MPMSRYVIRNEYSLADPELYRAADKDDPEALLEGVAMAGLVGVLRQLGDLAEFAAEIFHDLHEEVMATAARGHGLMIRVQQLEAEVPLIEKSLLSQTDQSSSFYNTGLDWHPNVRMRQNLVTQGDLPRFIMDSYEECRGPPRLFLLDKFDVGGAGACLKRYTDPSFFKVEASEVTGADLQREKKTRKAKKKGPRLRNGETPEVLPASHAKLHQLFLDEHVENGTANSARRAKLKRKLNGFPFDSKTGKSYMEKILRTSSPDHKMLDEVVNSSSLMLPPTDLSDSGIETLESGPLRQETEYVEAKRSPPSSPDRDGLMVNPSMYEPNAITADDKLWEAPNSYSNIVTNGISSTFDKVTGEEDKTMDGESKTEGSLSGSQSDDISSEIDNYVDAPSTIGSEIDTDSEMRMKGSVTSSYRKSKSLVSDAIEDPLLTRSSDSQSTGESAMSDEGINSLKKDISSFTSSDSPSTSAENPHSEKRYVEGFPSAGMPETDIVDSSPYQNIGDGDFLKDQHSENVFSDDSCRGTDTISNHRSDLELQASKVDLMIPVPPDDPVGVVREGVLQGPDSVETADTLDDDEKRIEPIIDPIISPGLSDSKSQPGDDSLGCSEPHAVDESAEAYTSDSKDIKTELVMHRISSACVSDSVSQSGDDSPRSSAGGRVVDESIGDDVPCTSTVSSTFCHTKEGSAVVSFESLLEDDFEQNDLSLIDDVAVPLNTCNMHDTPEMISTEIPIPSKLEDEIPNISDHRNIAHTGEDILSTVSKGEKPINELDHSNVSSDASEHSPGMLDASPVKELEETSFSNVQNLEDADYCSNYATDDQIGSANVIPPHVEKSDCWPRAGVDPDGADIVPEGETTFNATPVTESPEFDPDDADIVPEGETGFNATPATESPESLDVVGLQGVGIADDAYPDDSAALESPKNLGETTGASDTIEKKEIPGILSEPEATETLGSADMMSQNDGHALLYESDAVLKNESSADLEHPVNLTPLNEGCVLLDETDDVPLNESFEVRESLEDLEETAGLSVMLESDGIACSASGQEVSETVKFADVKLLNEIDVLLDEPSGQKEQEDTADMASPVPAATGNSDPDGVSADPDKLVEGLNNCFDDSGLHEVEDDMNSLSESHRESGLLEDLVQSEVASSDPDTAFFNTVTSDFPKSEESGAVPSSYLDPVTEHSLHGGDGVSIPSTPELCGLDTAQDSFHENAAINKVSGAPCLPVDYSTEGTLLQEKIELPSTKHNKEWQSAGEISSQLSPNNQHNAGSTLSYGNNPTPPELSELPGISNHEVNGISVNFMDQIGSIFPPNNLFPETNHINLDELPPLPPLPPVQWRMGRFQFGSSAAEREVAEQKESFPERISSPTAYTNRVSSSLEETNNSLVQIAPPSASEEEKVERSSSVSAVNSLNETIELPQKVGDNQQQPTTSSNDVGSLHEEVNHSLTQVAPTLATKEEKVENCSSSLEVDAMQDTVHVIPTTENETVQPLPSNDDDTSHGDKKHSLIQTSSKQSSSHLEASDKHESNNLAPFQLVMPSSETKSASPAAEDGVQNGSGTVKLPRPRNPLIDAVAAIDKSKLRKVTDRVRPQVQKIDERDSILEQIRTKSFNLKPTVASRPSFRGPGTNLKVAAILEKANAIRQALAGSDEDDEDSWSDS